MLVQVNQILSLWFVIPLAVSVGAFLLFYLRFSPIYQWVDGVRHLFGREDSSAEGSISNWQAVSAVLAGNLGTGNISGMAVALSTGGAGALVWMWIIGLFGMGLKYVGCYLGVTYRKINQEGEYVGGPMYYLADGLQRPFLAALFCIFTIAAAFTVGNLVQINSLVLPLEGSRVSSVLVSVVIACVIGVTLLGGLGRIAQVVSAVVPLMTCLYLAGAVLILFLHIDAIPAAVVKILHSAFGKGAPLGALAGWITAVVVGAQRGIFATDAGTGIAPILQSSARASSAKEEGLVAMVPPVVVLVVCTITMLVLLVTGADQVPGIKSTGMCIWAFTHGLGTQYAGWLVIFALVLFGFTTVLAWAFCAEKAVEYLFGTKMIPVCHTLFVACVPLGAIASVELAWGLADLSIGLMLCCNCFALIGLRKKLSI